MTEEIKKLDENWIPIENTGSRNLGVFEKNGEIIKLVKPDKSINLEKLKKIRQTLKRLNLLKRVIVPSQIKLVNYNGIQVHALHMPKAFGIQGNKITDVLISEIPIEQFEQFERDIIALSESGISTDLTKRSNFFYSKLNGFVFIDIDQIQDSPTDKFFVEGGVKKYFEFERFPYIPKIYKTSKELFTNARKI